MENLHKNNFGFSYDYNELKKLRKKQYDKWKWIILLCCLLLQMFPYCISLNLNNALAPSFLNWLGQNPTLYGLGFTLGSIISALFGPFVAKLFKKNINIKFIYILGVTVAMVGFGIISINAALPPSLRTIPIATTILWLSNILCQVGVMIFSGLGINNLISKWWPQEKRGFALGIAFTGGSLGNIWMQQLLAFLIKTFKNNSIEYANQYATFLILSSMGLFFSLLIIFLFCKKPLADISIMCSENNKINQIKLSGISPIATKNYPFYWILCIGYLILQMGGISSSINGIVVKSATVIDTNLSVVDILATGGTLFGVSCLIGNFFGGILNDKLGPHKSIFIAGTLQCIAIFLLMYSVKIYWLVYAYYIILGFSVYVFTSTPSFISGKLYGVAYSNNHMAILGIFIAIGFALSNSIYGVLIGETNETNINYLFGEKTYGNINAIFIYMMSCVAVGTFVVSLSTFIILKKGQKAIEEFTFSKYTFLMFFKYSLIIWIYAQISIRKNNNILLIKNNEKIIKRNNLSINDKNIKNELINIMNYNKNYNSNFQYLLHKEFIIKNGSYSINKEWIKSLNCLQKNNYYFDDCIPNYEKINIIMNKNLKKINKLKVNFLKKQAKLNNKISTQESINIDQNKENKIKIKYQKKQKKLESKFNNKIEHFNNSNDWKKYNFEYEHLVRLINIKKLMNKYALKKQDKINNLSKKKMINEYILNFYINEFNESNKLFINYYQNKHLHFKYLLNKKINDILNSKINKFEKKIEHINLSLNKENKIKNTLLKINTKSKLKKLDLYKQKINVYNLKKDIFKQGDICVQR